MNPTPPLIPRTLLFGNPERSSPRVSPDGMRLAYLAPDERGVLQVWMRTLGEADDRILTADRKRGIRMFVWTFDEEHLIYLQDAEGDENWHLYSVGLSTGVVRDLTPFQGIQAQLVGLDPSRPHELLAGMNLRDRSRFDVYRIELRTGAVTLDTENPGNIVSWTADAQLRVRAALSALPDGGSELLVRGDIERPWEPLIHWGPEDEGHAVAFSKDGGTLYFAGSHGYNCQRALALDLETREERVLAQDPGYDCSDILLHPRHRTVQAVTFVRERLQWEVLDPEIEPDLERLRTLRSGDCQIVSRDLDDRHWIVAYTTDDGPIYYSLFDRSSRKAELLFSNQPGLEGLSLASMRPIQITARDGLTLQGYLTLPVGAEPSNLPAVVLVHGGPWARDTWGYRPDVQWLANRGYAVLQLNFRGSTGYGKRFLHAGDREWAGAMHTDLLDGVDWLVGQGVADPARIGIMGGSYGGYATLAALTFTPEVFACGVDLVGPSNLLTLMETIPPYWKPLQAIFHQRVGNAETEPEFLRSRSPFFFADRIRKPLLIAQGANDPRVKQNESDQIVGAMRAAGIPVEYLIYADEGHGFARPENRLHFYACAEAFLAHQLNGRHEPATEIVGHSASTA